MDFLPQITGSFAEPAAENPTVEMIEAAYRHHGMHWRYLNCEVPPERLAAAVRGAWAMGWAGFNCSLPHKVEVISHLEGLGESARLIGAVNCAVRTEAGFRGENTDGKGFLRALQQRREATGQSVVLLGAGGAARAIAVELALAGARSITIVNRGERRREELAELLRKSTDVQVSSLPWSRPHVVSGEADLLVNATSIGLHPDDSTPAVEAESLREGLLVADVIPNPPHTGFLEIAAEQGCETLDGLGMLVEQGIEAVEHWTGRSVDGAVMRRRLEELFAAG